MVVHVLRDGTVLPDITGHVVKVEDAATAYALIRKMNGGKDENIFCSGDDSWLYRNGGNSRIKRP